MGCVICCMMNLSQGSLRDRSLDRSILSSFRKMVVSLRSSDVSNRTVLKSQVPTRTSAAPGPIPHCSLRPQFTATEVGCQEISERANGIGGSQAELASTRRETVRGYAKQMPARQLSMHYAVSPPGILVS